MKPITFRYQVAPGDDKIVRDIIVSTGFFYDFEIPVAVELIREKLEKGDQSTYQFVFAEVDGKPVAFSCFGFIAGTEHSYDLYWIATHDDYRGQGIGKVLLEEIEQRIYSQGGTNIIAETSTIDKYKPTRQFYENMGYVQTGLIRDYYKEGDGKVTFVKRM